MAVPQTIKTKTTMRSRNPTSCYLPQKFEIQALKQYLHPMFTAALRRRAQRWKEPKCPSTDKWVQKMRRVYIYIYIIFIYNGKLFIQKKKEKKILQERENGNYSSISIKFNFTRWTSSRDLLSSARPIVHNSVWHA